MRYLKRNSITTSFCICCVWLCGLQSIHGFEQSSYALFQIVEDASDASVEDGRLPIQRSLFQPAKPKVTKTVDPPAATDGVQLDFTQNSFGGDRTSFGSSFGDFTSDTSQPKEEESFDLGGFGTGR